MTLFDVGPADESTLTRRQAAALAAARAPEGTDASEAGRAAHVAIGCRFCGPSHACKYAERDGNALLRRLRDLGLVKYRAKAKTWQATTGRESPQDDGFPDGF